MDDPVTEDELVRARIDPVFRRQFLAQNLNRLLEALKKMRLAHQTDDTARQIREGCGPRRKACRSASKGRGRDARCIEAVWRAVHKSVQRCFALPFRQKTL